MAGGSGVRFTREGIVWREYYRREGDKKIWVTEYGPWWVLVLTVVIVLLGMGAHLWL